MAGVKHGGFPRFLTRCVNRRRGCFGRILGFMNDLLVFVSLGDRKDSLFGSRDSLGLNRVFLIDAIEFTQELNIKFR